MTISEKTSLQMVVLLTTNMVLLQSKLNPNELHLPKRSHDEMLEILIAKKSVYWTNCNRPCETQKRSNPSSVQIDICITQDSSWHSTICVQHIVFFRQTDEIQPICAYSGFQYSVHSKQVKSKAYLHQIRSTVHQAMVTCKEIADYKSCSQSNWVFANPSNKVRFQKYLEEEFMEISKG